MSTFIKLARLTKRFVVGHYIIVIVAVVGLAGLTAIGLTVGKQSFAEQKQSCTDASSDSDTQNKACAKQEKPKPEEKPAEQTPPAPEQPKPEVMPATTQSAPAPAPMPATGADGMAGLFVGTSVAGAIGHRLYVWYRNRK